MTYVVLVILIALWAIVLVPPYLKDRRASGRTFRPTGSIGSMSEGALRTTSHPQRFMPLQHATGAPSRTTAELAGPAVVPLGGHAGTNVVPLHPLVVDEGAVGHRVGEPSRVDESMWEQPRAGALGSPASMAAARERRRQVLMALFGTAFATVVLALLVGGIWVTLHILVDLALLGYVILLVRRRQISTEARTKVAPIRPPVTVMPPVTVQAAPSYLVGSGS